MGIHYRDYERYSLKNQLIFIFMKIVRPILIFDKIFTTILW
jgi:hypothetical protein